MNLRNMFGIIVLSFIATTLVSYFSIKDFPLYSAVLIMSALMLILIFNYLILSMTYSVFILINAVLILFYYHRAIFLIVYPESYYHEAYYSITIDKINVALEYLIFAVLIVNLGVLIGSYFPMLKNIRKIEFDKADMNINKFPLKIFSVITTIALLLHIGRKDLFPVLPLGTDWIFRFTVTVFPFIILMVVALTKWGKLNLLDKSILLIAIGVNILYPISAGSRRILFDLIVLYFIIKVLAQLEFYKIKRKMMLIMFIFAPALIIVGYRVLSVIKVLTFWSGKSVWKILSEVSFADAAQMYYENVQSTLYITLESLSRRLGYLDNLTMILNEKAPLLEEYMNFEYLIKSFLEYFLPPGLKFGVYNTSMLVDVIYLQKEYASLGVDYHTDQWTIALFLIYFGKILGFVMMFLFFFMLTYLYKYIYCMDTNLNLPFRVIYLYSLLQIVQFFGFEIPIVDIINRSVALIIFLSISSLMVYGSFKVLTMKYSLIPLRRFEDRNG